MAYIIRVYYNDELYSIDLSKYSRATIGSGENDTIRLNAGGLNSGHITFDVSADGCEIKAKKLLYREDSRMTRDSLEVGATYILETNPEIYIAVHPKQSDSMKTVWLGENKEITIGRDYKNSIVLKNMRTSSRHIMIYSVGNGYMIKDLGSKNGTYVNGRRIAERLLNSGDIINISVYKINFVNNTLSFDNVGDDIEFNIATHTKEEDYIDTANELKDRSKTFSLFGENEETEIPKKGTVSLFD